MSQETVDACGGTWRLCGDAAQPRACQCDKCGAYGYGIVHLAKHASRPGFRGTVLRIIVNGKQVFP